MNVNLIFRTAPVGSTTEEANNWRATKSCKRKPNAECSPSEGPCCEQSCQFTSRTKVTFGTKGQQACPSDKPNLCLQWCAFQNQNDPIYEVTYF